MKRPFRGCDFLAPIGHFPAHFVSADLETLVLRGRFAVTTEVIDGDDLGIAIRGTGRNGQCRRDRKGAPEIQKKKEDAT